MATASEFKKVFSLALREQKSLFVYNLGDQELKPSPVERDLGVLVDNNLKFHEHTADIIRKSKRTLGIIKRSFSYLDENIMKKLYKSLVRPVIEYANVIWGPLNVGDSKLLEKVQRRATKMVKNIRNLTYEERLRRMKLPSLKYRRRRGDMILVYKLVSGMLKTDGIVKRSAPRYAIRGHHLRLVKQRATKRPRRNHLTIRSVNDWNSLPGWVVSAPSLNIFKTKLDKFWSGEKYKFD